VSIFRRRTAEVEERGRLYPAVREALLDVRAYARSHGGDIELVGVTDEGVVKVRLRGTCRSCPLSGITLKHGAEAQLKVLVPGVLRLEQVK
jgi:Fe-S cluster biogenesis protein NfuA